MKNSFMILLSSLLFIGTTFAQSPTQQNVDDEIDTYYYENSKLEFAEGVDMDKYEAINPSAEFSLIDGTVKVTVVLQMDKPFKTTGFIVDIYDEYDDLYDTFEIDIEESWDFASFIIDFDESGLYFIDIYNSDDIFINTGELEIE